MVLHVLKIVTGFVAGAVGAPGQLEVELLPDGPRVKIHRFGRGEARWLGHDA